MFREERDESQFTWSMLGDIEAGRPNLGPMVHVAVYRLMQYTLRDILIRDFGVEKADRIFSEAGKKAGAEYCDNVVTDKSDLSSFFADIQRTMKELGIGIFRVESADSEKGSFVVTVAEDLDCSGIPACSEEVCIYDEGFIAGLLLAYTGKDFHVKEVDCWGSGGRVCRFTVIPK
ncbi:V4R domain-containing protein [Desulfobacca acetoxidans]|uniref:4-vinyl reductase 4VR n=1 Tax=Desulfobacca acetoxidans (strain ATCC 700848 / DSM 11109 / ASRB2) TaxID=880072 RepID=F2NFS7_DESAR|nr:V4R domain-containing protein [Desulfobacca acetoxidans]AEB10196.1 4-vinyl reductase 4VR [Desulfobacca acetoxidans DSM 11109]